MSASLHSRCFPPFRLFFFSIASCSCYAKINLALFLTQPFFLRPCFSRIRLLESPSIASSQRILLLHRIPPQHNTLHHPPPPQTPTIPAPFFFDYLLRNFPLFCHRFSADGRVFFAVLLSPSRCENPFFSLYSVCFSRYSNGQLLQSLSTFLFFLALIPLLLPGFPVQPSPVICFTSGFVCATRRGLPPPMQSSVMMACPVLFPPF